ncbi:MAG: T9SS type A sorting domain-containing protein [Crocinitomicaceae bacterium]
MIKYLFLFTINIFVVISTFSQSDPSFVWARHGKSIGVDKFQDVALDQNGFVYTVGNFDEDLIIGTDTFPVVSSGNSCGIITKWDSNGVYQWGMSLGNLGYPIELYRILISDQNEVYVSGRLAGTCYIGTNAQGVDTTLYSTGSLRSFIAKYNTDGVLSWTRLLEGTYDNWIWNLEFDPSNNLVIVGDYNADVDFGNGHTLTAYHQLDCFAAWFDPSGVCFNHLGYHGHLEERMYDIAFDSQGNYAIGGAFNDSIFIGSDTLLSNGTGDAFISYYNSNGVLQWYDYFGGSQNSFINSDMVTNVEFDSNDEIYATGVYRDTLFFGQDSLISRGNIDSYLIKYDALGQKLNYNTIGGSSSGDAITGLQLDNSNNLYMTITGNNISYEDTTYYFFHGLDILVLKMNPNLEIEWLKRGGSNSSDYASDLCLSPYGDVYVACQPGDNDPISFDTISFSPVGNNWYSCVLAKLSFHAPRYVNIAEYKNVAQQYSLYPNPTSDFISIKGIESKETLFIVDQMGKVILEKSQQLSQPIEISNLSKGLYYFILPEKGVALQFVKN